MKEINFLETQRRRLVQQNAQDKRISQISFGILGVVLIVFGFFWGYNYYLTSTIDNLQTEIGLLESQLDVSLKKQGPYLLFMHKLNQIENLISDRQNGLDKLDFLDANLGSASASAKASNFRYDMSEGTISTSIVAKNVFSAQDIFAELNQEGFQENFPSVDYGGLNRSRSGNYSFSTVFNLRKK